MLSQECVRELRTAWLPNLTDSGLDRVIELLEQGSPLLVRGSFTAAAGMGCLATHAAWHHPRTAHLTVDAGITWLHHVAGLNPATSQVLAEWDRTAPGDVLFRMELLEHLKAERLARRRQRRRPNRLGGCVGV